MGGKKGGKRSRWTGRSAEERAEWGRKTSAARWAKKNGVAAEPKGEAKPKLSLKERGVKASKARWSRYTPRYPFKTLKPGESFFVAGDCHSSEYKSSTVAMSKNNKRYRDEKVPMRFTSRRCEEGGVVGTRYTCVANEGK